MPSYETSVFDKIYSYGSSTAMADPQTIYCVECLRIIVKEHAARGGGSIEEPRYSRVGSNHLWGSMRPEQAAYVVDGTYFCAAHAIEVYAPEVYTIEETV